GRGGGARAGGDAPPRRLARRRDPRRAGRTGRGVARRGGVRRRACHARPPRPGPHRRGWMDELIAALRHGRPALFPTDTVYGLVSLPAQDAVARLYTLKGRRPRQPTALLAGSVDQLLEAVPELDARRLLNGPYTFVLPNPARRLPWLTRERAHAIRGPLPRPPTAAP